MRNTLLGGLTPDAFMRRHWQKRARLIRGAIPGFGGVVTRDVLFDLAARDDVDSRLVIRSGAARRAQWSLERGPFRKRDFSGLPPAGWTLLVQGVDLHVDAAAALLQRFAFIPYARLDDLMISYAVPGGGVGPHFDSYDVFLLQGPGRRRWQTSTQQDLSLRPGLPLRILARFAPDEDWTLDPGDMLYLPPSVAHDGEAVTECMTYSIGFRAPTTPELVEGFLQFLPDALTIEATRYADPERRATTRPALIDTTLQTKLGAMLKAVQWDRATVARFVGCMLSEPKPDVFFDPPERPLGYRRFAERVAHHARGGVRLDRRARMLYDSSYVYLNGAVIADVAGHPALAQLADARRLASDTQWPDASLRVLYDAYLTGAVHAGQKDD